MKMESNKTIRFIVLAILIGHASLVVLEGPSTRTNFVQVLVLDALTPMEHLVDFTTNKISSAWQNYVGLHGTHRENEKLHEENAELRMTLARNRAELRETDRLRRFLEMNAEVYKKQIVARVINQNPTFVRQTLTINHKTTHDVHVNSTMITPNGITSQMIGAAHYSAIVQLISDPSSTVSVIVDSTHAQNIIQNWDDGLVRLEHVDDSTLLEVNDELVTSRTDQIYPKGLPVKWIVDVGRPDDLLKTATVKPSVDLARLEEVLVLTSRTVTVVPIDPKNPDSY